MMITRIAFYDFDGTLVDSPMPDTGREIWKQKTGKAYSHEGWWGIPESLNLDVFDIKVFPDTVRRLNADMARPDTYVVILTARVTKIIPAIEKILQKYNIKVDEISANSGADKDKDLRIKRFLQKFPNVKEVDVYDDREKEFKILLPLRDELADVVRINVYAVDNGSIRLLETVNSIKTLIYEEIYKIITEGKSPTESLKASKNIPKEMKEKILQYGIGEYKEGGFVKGISIPEELKNKSPKTDGISLGADKNGFYVYTHRARSKSYDTPEKIPVKDIEFIESTG